MPSGSETSQEVNVRARYRSFLLNGLVGGLLANLISYIAASLFGLPYPPEAVFQILVSPIPGAVESRFVETLGELPKYGTFAFAVALYTLLYGAIAVAVGYLYQTKRITSRHYLLALAITIPTMIGLGFQGALAASSTIAATPAIAWVTAATVLIVANLFFAKIAVDGYQANPAKTLAGQMAANTLQPRSASRRSFIKKAALGVAVIVAAAVASWLGFSVLEGQPISSGGSPIPVNNPPETVTTANLPSVFRDPRINDLLSSEVTDTRLFYRIDIDPIPPQLDANHWSLKVFGKVNNPLTIDQNQFTALPATNEYATLECVSSTINPPGGLISNAKWTGVEISTLLKEAGVTSDAKYLVFHCADGYTVGVPLDRASGSGGLIASKMNDLMLPREHGFPLRAIFPGIYGMMNAKWITEIELTDQVYLGYWQERGWSNDAKIKTTSLIYYPPAGAQVTESIPIAGVAFAGDRGISKVQVSTDGGKTWSEAVMKTPLSPYSWILWAYAWTPSENGKHTIIVRATDGAGQLQDPSSRANFPDGATGYYAISVDVA